MCAPRRARTVVGMLIRPPLVTLAAAAVVGAGLLAADVLTDPARNPAPPVPVTAATSAAPASATTSAATPSSTTSSTTTSSTTSTTTSTTTTSAPTWADAYRGPAVYVGRDTSRRTSVAVAVRAGQVAAYVCDGRSVESWLTGTASGSTVTLAGGADRLVAEVAAGGLHVTGTVRGRPIDVTAALASAPAGLYRLDSGSGSTVGWIVQPDGTQVGLLNRRGAVEPAPVLTPGQAVTVDGRTATPKEVSGDDRF